MDPNEEQDSFLDATPLPPPKRKRATKLDTALEAMNQISNRKIDLFVKQMEDGVSPELRDFFSSISRTVNKFDAYNQIIVKKKILDLVTNMELEQFRSRQIHISTVSAADEFPSQTDSFSFTSVEQLDHDFQYISEY